MKLASISDWCGVDLMGISPDSFCPIIVTIIHDIRSKNQFIPQWKRIRWNEMLAKIISNIYCSQQNHYETLWRKWNIKPLNKTSKALKSASGHYGRHCNCRTHIMWNYCLFSHLNTLQILDIQIHDRLFTLKATKSDTSPPSGLEWILS